MAENNNDVIMYMTLDTGQVAAEARSQLDDTDDMVSGCQYYDDFQQGRFFELKSFSFGVSVKEGSKTAAPEGGSAGKGAPPPAKNAPPPKPGVDSDQLKKILLMPDGPEKQRAIAAMKGPKEFEFKDFMEGGNITAYPVELASISYERIMDKASAPIWNYFISQKVVSDAVILKRKDDGWQGGPQGFFALVFKDLIITDIDWEGDDLILEKVKMVCRSALILYKRQRPDIYTGTLVGRHWSYLKNDPFGS